MAGLVATHPDAESEVAGGVTQAGGAVEVVAAAGSVIAAEPGVVAGCVLVAVVAAEMAEVVVAGAVRSSVLYDSEHLGPAAHSQSWDRLTSLAAKMQCDPAGPSREVAHPRSCRGACKHRAEAEGGMMTFVRPSRSDSSRSENVVSQRKTLVASWSTLWKSAGASQGR